MVKLIITKGEKVKEIFTKNLKSSSKNVIAILSAKSYSVYRPIIEKNCNKKGKRCLFLDTINKIEKEGVIYIPASNLTALSIAINQAQQSFTGKTTIIFDSITGFTLMNKPEVLVKFLLFIIRKSRDWGSEVIIIMSNSSLPPNLLELLKQSSDEIKEK